MNAIKTTDYENLTDQDLLRMIIKERADSNCSEGILKDRNLVDLIFDTTPEEILAVSSKAKAYQIMAMQEMIKRIIQMQSKCNVKVTCPADVFNFIRSRFFGLKKEKFYILLLDTKNQIIRDVEISSGSLNACIVDPRLVFRVAVKSGTNSIVLVHNHPSGIPEPSAEDRAITKRLVEAGKLMSIQVIDHVIICEHNGYWSFNEHGEL